IYQERRKVLEGANTRENIEGYIRGLIEMGVETHCVGRHPELWDTDGLVQYLGTYFPLAAEGGLSEEVLASGPPGLIEFLYERAMVAYEAKAAEAGPDLIKDIEKWVMLKSIDMRWVDYLTTMDHFREGIGLMAYAQKDPLVEYKNEAFSMFNELTDSIQADIVTNMFRVQFKVESPAPPVPPPTPVLVATGPGQQATANGQMAAGGRAPVPAGAKVGRNDLCPCGSGKKYKRCHGAQ
ncbi:MAG TPA: SEC-C metal-binding domain-containing protein, partial [Candidatus Dormibacteraeota bacterium]|nr:SEC-C metal-binding domain-containing protein [Candidatus Dormibacteraeota bacterium]